MIFYAVESGFFDDMEKEQWGAFETVLLQLIRNRYPHLLEAVRNGKFGKDTEMKIKEMVEDSKQEFISN